MGGYECGSHILNGCELVAPEVELPFVEGVGELGGLLDEFSCNLHFL